MAEAGMAGKPEERQKLDSNYRENCKQNSQLALR